MSNYQIKKNESIEVILKFWEQSPDATVFTHPKVLSKLIDEVRWLIIYKGNEPICMWPICNPNIRNGGNSRFLYYVGPIWSKLRLELSYSSFFEMATQAYDLFMNEIRSDNSIIEASFPITLNDLRFISWNTRNKKDYDLKVQIIPKYTAIINNLELMDVNLIAKNLQRSRKREIVNFASQKSLYKCDKINFFDVINLYNRFFQEKNENRNEKDLENVKKLCELVEDGFGYYIGYRNSQNNDLVSVLITLYGNKVANGILGITLDEYKYTGVGTVATFESIIKAKELCLSTYDLNGANSPILAKFKHSMGAIPMMYFDLKFHHN
jgi:hypothetical protein